MSCSELSESSDVLGRFSLCSTNGRKMCVVHIVQSVLPILKIARRRQTPGVKEKPKVVILSSSSATSSHTAPSGVHENFALSIS